ncbi:DUF134 domain-containing protein [Candidatus Woesearchaeota archaeon]|nr:DUF134 domain-containing protein [Candidatus Woesearchaeota archaeon]
MPRPRHCRRVCYEPEVIKFKPSGVRGAEIEQITLRMEEMEAVRLKDLVGLSQIDAAKQMNVSQPTFHRTLNQGRSKLADAIVNGKQITIEGGAYHMAKGMRLHHRHHRNRYCRCAEPQSQ